MKIKLNNIFFKFILLGFNTYIKIIKYFDYFYLFKY